MTDSAVRHAAILLIGLDERTLRVMTWLLLEGGYDLAKASSAEEASQKMHIINPAVIVLDVPVARQRDGDVASLRSAFPNARIIGIHAHDDANAHIDAEGHLHKPFHAEELLGLVSSLLSASVGSKSSHAHL